LDIHAGGIDLVFPHHENEIAQAEAVTHKPFARFWLHSEHLHVESQKMSKSLGNFYTMRDLLNEGYAPETIRYLLASVPYRKKLNFTFEGLKGAAKSIERLRDFRDRVRSSKFPDGRDEQISARTQQAVEQFEAAMDDDLNTAEALAAVYEYVRAANTAMDNGQFHQGNRDDAERVLTLFDDIFDVLTPTPASATQGLSDEDVNALIEQRNQAKKARDFKRSDEIRASLLENGIIIEDTKDGVRWKRK
jgi:cysteinyl-tRNA synthetase